MTRSMRNTLRLFSSEGVAILNEEQELIKNSLLKFKKCPYPNNESGWRKGYRSYISECKNYLLLEDSEVYFKDNGHDGYRPNGLLKIWVRIEDRTKAWGIFDGVPYKEITSLPYNYVHDVEESIAYIERWNKKQQELS